MRGGHDGGAGLAGVAVVIPLTTSSWMMLRRNPLDTGITRVTKPAVLAGSRRALAAAVRTPGAGRRHTKAHPPPGPKPVTGNLA